MWGGAVYYRQCRRCDVFRAIHKKYTWEQSRQEINNCSPFRTAEKLQRLIYLFTHLSIFTRFRMCFVLFCFPLCIIMTKKSFFNLVFHRYCHRHCERDLCYQCLHKHVFDNICTNSPFWRVIFGYQNWPASVYWSTLLKAI